MTTGNDLDGSSPYLNGEIPEFVRVNTLEEFNSMASKTKPAIKSTTVQGSILAILGSVGAYLEAAGKLPLGGAGPIVAAVGGLLSLVGRFKSTTILSGWF